MKLLICQSCGVIIRSRGKHCTGCGVTLALSAPTAMPLFAFNKAPASVSVPEDHLLLERVVTERQLSVLRMRPRPSSLAYEGDDYQAQGYSDSYEQEPTHGGGGKGGNGHGNGNGGNGGNGHGYGSAGGGSPDPYASQEPYNQEPQQQSSDSQAAYSGQVATQYSSGGALAPMIPGAGRFFSGGFSSADFGGSSSSSYSDSDGSSYSDPGAQSQQATEPLPSTFDGFGMFALDREPTPSNPLVPDVEPESGYPQSSSSGFFGEPQPAPQPAPQQQTQAPSGAGLPVAGNYFGPDTGAAISIAIGGSITNNYVSTATPRPQQAPEPLSASPEPPVARNDAPEEPFATPAESVRLVETESAPAADISDQLGEGTAVPAQRAESEFNSPLQSSRSDAPGEVSNEAPSAASFVPPSVVEPAVSASEPGDFFNSPKVTRAADPDDFFASAGPSTVRLPDDYGEESSSQSRTGTSSTNSADNIAAIAAAGIAGIAAGAAIAAAVSHKDESKSAAKESEGPAESEAARKEVMDFFGGSPTSSADGFDFFAAPQSAASRRKSMEEQEFSGGSAEVAETKDEDAPPPASEERPKVAMPKVKDTGSRPKVKQIDDEHDDEDDESEDADVAVKADIPKRRSFSSGSTGDTKKKSPAKVKKKTARDEEDDEADGDDDHKPSKALWLEEEISFMGLNVSRKTAGVLIAVGLFIVIQVPGWLMTFSRALSGQPPQQVASNPQSQPLPGQPMGQPGMPGAMPGAMPGQPGAFGGRQFPGQPAMQGSMGGTQTGGAPDPNAQYPTVAGEWQIRLLAGTKPYDGRMILRQQGLEFAGEGADSAGRFEVQGRLVPPDQIQLNKRYDNEARKHGAHQFDVLLGGKLETEGGLLSCAGVYQTKIRRGSNYGYLNKQTETIVRGKWMAKQTRMLVAQKPAMNPIPTIGLPTMPKPNVSVPNPFDPGSNSHQPNYKHAQEFFLWIAGGLIAIGVAIFGFFLMIFGPSGKMNVWEKNKYIPSQFRGQHMKLVRELGAPVQPGGVPLGKRLEWHWWCFWQPKYLAIPPAHRAKNPHMLLLGGGDKGKTCLMASMVAHDIKSNDRAIVIIDSDGQLSDLIVNWIASQPEGLKYAKRVVLIDPTYKAGSLAYNPLEMPSDGNLQSAASAIVHGFKAIYTEPPGSQSQWNAQTANILRNAALLLMANGRTLVDLPNLLQDNDFRDIMLESVERAKAQKTEYITILETWNQYKKLARTDQWINWVEPILNRVGPMLSDGRIRPILTKPVSDLKLRDIILEKKILIVKVPEGELDQNANLLGSLMVTGLQQAGMALAKEFPNRERPVALYLDEMDNFIEKETIENITSETRHYQVGFCGAIKTLQHLPEDYRNQLIINMSVMAVFALAKKDGDMLGPQMFRVDGRKIKHQTIQNFFNQVNTSPQFELIMDEEKLNIDRIVGQNEQTYFCYQVGTVAGVFQLKAHDFKEVPEKKINKKLVEKMHAVTDSFDADDSRRKKKSAKTDED